MEKLIKISGILIFISLVLTLYSYFFESSYLIYAGSSLWLAFFIFFFTLNRKKMILSLFMLSMLAFTISYINDYAVNIKKIISINQYLITLLVAVSFLKLIKISKSDENIIVPQGKKSFLSTYMSVYLFSSVINISALVLIADKLYQKSKLTNTQIILLSRSFASNAYWSPFFVSFAAAVTYAPNLNTSVIFLNGLIFSCIIFVLTYYEVTHDKSLNINEFRGYSLSLDNLIVPIVLAFLVLFTHHLYENSKIIILISIYSLLLSFGFSFILDGLKKTIQAHTKYITEELPKMKGEISLFLVAGMFGVSMSSILLGLDISIPFDTFDWRSASLLLLIFIVLGFVGIHPIISIAIIGDYISQIDHTLFAVAFLMAWATTISTSAFSGLSLTMVSRYKLDAKKIFDLNIVFALKIYILSVFSLYIVSKYLNL